MHYETDSVSILAATQLLLSSKIVAAPETKNNASTHATERHPTMGKAMTKEHSFVAGEYSDRDLYISSQTWERVLNTAIVQANIIESFEEYFEVIGHCVFAV